MDKGNKLTFIYKYDILNPKRARLARIGKGEIMKSIKPGRAPSMMSAAMSVIVGIFGVVWTIIAANISGIMAIFGIIFIIIAIVQAVYHYKNATSQNRYSSFDVVDSAEEPDPLNNRYGQSSSSGPVSQEKQAASAGFCPYCGTPMKKGFVFCPKCGKRR